MQNAKSKFSIIIPVKAINDYLRKETIPAILNQTFGDFEIIIMVDGPSKEKFAKTKIISGGPLGPADKRDYGAKIAKGDILAFLDDDSYPEKNWLENASEIFSRQETIVGLGGPTLTPSNDSVYQKASGYVWSTWLGSGGAGTYRCTISQRREIDDYPTVNFLVRKNDFWLVGGFDSHFWPGEDTKLCHDLVFKLKKKIIYDPSVLVYHHRRPVFKLHLEQIIRYAIHRGHFAKVLPRTSLRIGYLLPTLFLIAMASGLFIFSFPLIFKMIYLVMVGFYWTLLLLTAAGVYLKEKNFKLVFLVVPSIFLTHFVYGLFFLKGFFSKSLER